MLSDIYKKFGTKAETLRYLDNKSRNYIVPYFFYFSLQEWNKNKDNLCSGIREKFVGKLLAVRSSAACEDTLSSSMAGVFKSKLNVSSNRSDLIDAVDEVIESYSENNNAELDQVIIQKMVSNVALSGVAMTHVLESGAPYYVISYDDVSGKTDTVTSGNSIHKTVYIHRQASDLSFRSDRLRAVIHLIRGVESVMGVQPMDIEFTVDIEGNAYLLQVRPISTFSNWDKDIEYKINSGLPLLGQHLQHLEQPHINLSGKRTVYANMADWNPAEMIQSVPKPLASSLYRKLITESTWAFAREKMGYSPINGIELMKLIGGHAYIDVRASLNSFLPLGLNDVEKESLINASLKRLVENPMYNDKIEFDVAITIRTPNFDDEFDRIYPELNEGIKSAFDSSLKNISNELVDCSDDGTLALAEKEILKLRERQYAQESVIENSDDISILSFSSILLQECKKYGTLPFAILARHGFIAECLLRGFVDVGAINEERVNDLKQSIQTVAGDLSECLSKCNTDDGKEKFLANFGHLRPGTYDIASLRYEDTPELFAHTGKVTRNESKKFELTSSEKNSIDPLLLECGMLSIDADGFVEYVTRAIKGREYGKLIFTRTLSRVIELLAKWGEKKGFTRVDMSFLTIEDILLDVYSPNFDVYINRLQKAIDERRKEWGMARSLQLPPIIKDIDDLYIIPLQRTIPNYVTRKRVTSDKLFLNNSEVEPASLENKIICIESADPGLDWIFSYNISGLITMYGGTNSHMTIRCAEFDLPAAIGVGEELFHRLVAANRLELNCGDKIIHIIS